MKKAAALVLLTLTLITTVSAKTATFQTDQTQSVTINNEQVNLELIGVDNYDEYPDMYSATFVNGNDGTVTVTSWNAHQNDYVQSQVNGEYVGLMNWQGVETPDDNTDDVATLAWGNAYFPCESYQTGENEIKWCSDDTTKQWEVGGETVNYEFMYVRETSGDPQVKQAVFLNEQGATVTISSKNAQEYGYTQDQINGRTVYAKVVRGAGTDRGSDDAVVLKKEEKTTCTYDFTGTVNGASSNGEIHVAGGFTTVAQDNSFGFTKTADCGSEQKVKYKEDGETVASKTVQVPEQNGEVQVTMEAQKTCTYDFVGNVRNGDSDGHIRINGGFTQLANDGSFGFTKTADCGSETKAYYSEGSKTVASKTLQLPAQGSEVEFTVTAPSEGYKTRTATNIKNLIGGPVREVKPKTEIKFGNDAQNTLYVHDISGDYMREAKVTMSARNKDGEKFILNWDNMVKGHTKQFSTGSYTVHLCGDSSPQKLKISISKKEGMSGYGACFTEKVADEGSFETVDYQVGQVADVTQGDVLVFGPNNMDRLYIENINREQNIDRYSMDAYANRLLNFKSVLPVAGTVTEAYFYSGKYPVHFCSFQNDQAKVVVSDQGVGSSEACQEDISAPEGSVTSEISRVPANSDVTVITEINSQGSYNLKASINGDPFTTKTIDQTGRATHKLTPPATGNVTVNLVAPGSWWNPLDSTELVSQTVIEVYEQDQEQGPSCQEMIENAKENAEDRVCAQVTAELTCGDGEATYTAKNSCEASYLQERGWEATGSSNPEEAAIQIGTGEIARGQTLNITTTDASNLNLVITGPGTDRQLSITDNIQTFNVDTGDFETGSYTAKILPQSDGGLLSGIIGDLIGGPLDAADFEVTQRNTWKTYCSSNGYQPESVDGQISCIEDQIVPQCFTENPGDQCLRVAQDVCEDLLGYGYNQTSAKCEPM